MKSRKALLSLRAVEHDISAHAFLTALLAVAATKSRKGEHK